MWIRYGKELINCDQLSGLPLKYDRLQNIYGIYARYPFLVADEEETEELLEFMIAGYNKRERAEAVFGKLTDALVCGARLFHMPTEEEMGNDDD